MLRTRRLYRTLACGTYASQCGRKVVEEMGELASVPVCRVEGASTRSLRVLVDLAVWRILVSLGAPFQRLLSLYFIFGRSSWTLVAEVQRWLLSVLTWFLAQPRNQSVRRLLQGYVEVKRWHFGAGKAFTCSPSRPTFGCAATRLYPFKSIRWIQICSTVRKSRRPILFLLPISEQLEHGKVDRAFTGQVLLVISLRGPNNGDVYGVCRHNVGAPRVPEPQRADVRTQIAPPAVLKPCLGADLS